MANTAQDPWIRKIGFPLLTVAEEVSNLWNPCLPSPRMLTLDLHSLAN